MLTTTRTFRRKLDLTRPVPREVIMGCLDLAVHAPSGSNRQGWRFVVIDEPDLRAAIAHYYRLGSAANLSGRVPTPEQLADFESATYLADHLHEVPALVLACQSGRPPTSPAKLASFYGSIFPAVWSFMLALRSQGLGTSLTTAHLAHERAVADVVGLPFDSVTQVALLPVAYLRAGNVSPGARIPAERVTSWNGWTSSEQTQ
ncbi:nitroreductase family protein [Antrihabitans stalagmiti]|uniref:nitroreductase family protein n=1 Tax=Antrihabitans stalagmiti TaxID=2799499 RepID=UPI0027DD3E7C|nr:nitroreductase family protein [Antrihabitans stalagmiti]